MALKENAPQANTSALGQCVAFSCSEECPAGRYVNPRAMRWLQLWLLAQVGMVCTVEQASCVSRRPVKQAIPSCTAFSDTARHRCAVASTDQPACWPAPASSCQLHRSLDNNQYPKAARLGTQSATDWHALATSTCRGDHLRHSGVPACPVHVATSAPVAMLHTRMLRSSQPAGGWGGQEVGRLEGHVGCSL